MSTTPETIQSEVKRYWKVFAALAIATIVTVAIANVHLGILLGIAAAIVVAVIKGSLVAGYFMHLLHERKVVYSVLILTAVFVVAMVGLILWTYGDQQGAQHGVFQVPPKRVEMGHHGEESPAAAAEEASH